MEACRDLGPHLTKSGRNASGVLVCERGAHRSAAAAVPRKVKGGSEVARKERQREEKGSREVRKRTG